MAKKKIKKRIEGLSKASAKIAVMSRIVKMDANEIAEMIYKNKDSFLYSAEWKELRKQVLIRYGFSCMRCGKRSKTGKGVNVDHIKPRKYYPELALDICNLQVLCASCNKNKGNKHHIDYRKNHPLGKGIV